MVTIHAEMLMKCFPPHNSVCLYYSLKKEQKQHEIESIDFSVLQVCFKAKLKSFQGPPQDPLGYPLMHTQPFWE